MTYIPKIITYVQAGGLGTRGAPLLHQPGLESVEVLSLSGRRLMPHNHNSYYAVAKPVLPYMATSLSEPLIRSAVLAGARDIRFTIHVLPETIVSYYRGRDLGAPTTTKFLYESSRLDTSGGIVRNVMAGLRSGSIDPRDIILVLGGDIRTNLNVAAFLEEHKAKCADITIMLAEVGREKMFPFGGASREGDSTPLIGKITAEDPEDKQIKEFSLYGNLALSSDPMGRITHFFEKAPKLLPDRVKDYKDREGMIKNTNGLDIGQILSQFGPGALSATNLQNGSVYAFRAQVIEQLAPLVFNLSPQANAEDWSEASDINRYKGPHKFSDFSNNWFMQLTGSSPLVRVNPESPIAEIQQRIIESLQQGLPQIFGYRHEGQWADDGTLPAILQGHFDILTELVEKGKSASWPISWDKVKGGYPSGVITMSHYDPDEVTVIPPVFIGSDVIIHAGARLGRFAIINRGWEISGSIERSVLFPSKKIDREIAGRGWQRFLVQAGHSIRGSLIGSGFELVAINQDGTPIPDFSVIEDKVVVSNGSQTVISPLDI